MSEIPGAAELGAAISGLSDQELENQIKEMGADNVLKSIFDGMEQAFLPEKAAGTEAVIQYSLAHDGDTKSWVVEVANGACTTREGTAEDPRITLSLSMVDFVRLIFRQIEGPQLFMSGKLKLKGDMMFAMQMQGFFERPS